MTIRMFMGVEMGWEEVHEEILTLARRGAEHERTLARALLRGKRMEVWKPLGMGSLIEYAERHLGFTPRQTEERLRVAEALEALPRLDAAMAAGELHFSAARELTRVAAAETEEAWLRAAAGKTVGEIGRMVSGRTPGDRPDAPSREEARRHRLVIEVSAEVYATYREAQGGLRREGFSEEEGLLLMARRMLGGPDDEGRSAFQVRMTMCEACGATRQEGRGQSVVVDEDVAQRAECDAQRLVDGAPAAQDIPPATRRLVVRRHGGRCGVPGCRHAVFCEVHHVVPRVEGGTHDPERLILMCAAHHGALHRGALRIEGLWSTGFRFFHADGEEYGRAVDARRAGVLGEVQLALRGLGFREREARGLTEAIRPHVGADVRVEEAVRMALRASREAAAPM